MVDVGAKAATDRRAVATAKVVMRPETLRKILDRDFSKGDVFEVARLAGIMGAKRTSELIPLCHPIALSSVRIDIAPLSATEVGVTATCGITAQTGVEMEALTAASVACLTIYDMCKAVDRGMRITDIQLESKTGGKSGSFARTAEPLGTPDPPGASE
jgi:cyclic pyranopterin phosphate synthase